ncbi:MAG: RNA methyltransferase [Bdellovibrionales bacterium]|nr:RNA methyltransferase [Bdellovibrionales bacterium]
MQQECSPLSVALVHYPVEDRAGKIVATNITNFDVHDIARVSRSYGVEKYVIIHRLQEQLMFVARLLDHWRVGRGATFNPKRRTALNNVVLAENLKEALALFTKRPLVVATAARDLEQAPPITFRQLRSRLEEDPGEKVLLLFGTGCGLATEIIEQCDYILEPIAGAAADHYRHLSVRSAVSICLDRLRGTW